VKIEIHNQGSLNPQAVLIFFALNILRVIISSKRIFRDMKILDTSTPESQPKTY